MRNFAPAWASLSLRNVPSSKYDFEAGMSAVVVARIRSPSLSSAVFLTVAPGKSTCQPSLARRPSSSLSSLQPRHCCFLDGERSVRAVASLVYNA